ncbi:ski oncogene-like isoform X2 [Ostrea edulis]|uniref:ski oncogene-like isoform X2 n=1 Tax=Ostrea edulis TaxID=37623 RepID=UPI0024AEE49F|nr:ski oncogene-like isoform X2 [Ostrea edulis]
MEHLSGQGGNPHLQRVLKSYQTAAMRSLQGPGPTVFPTLLSDMAELERYRKALVKKLPTVDKMEFGSLRAPPPFPIQHFGPVFTPMDSSKSEKLDTYLEDETIACFSVGGEKRLCLPQILNTVLREFSLQQINAVCDELHIYCSRCNQEQLEILKVTGILPLSAPSCGLITKTDAERLCNSLLHRSSERYSKPPSRASFKVYHECFGKCKGIFHPENYTSASDRCIQCCDCMGIFSPQKFVGHSHKAQENNTCHWGFDSSKWRAYLLLAKDQEGKDKLQRDLEKMKAKFDANRKRQQVTDSLSEPKRSKSDDGDYVSWSEASGQGGGSAFRPWSPGMISAMKDSKGLPEPPPIMREVGPPVLLNPERVVTDADTKSYERGFAPNVSLAPHQPKINVDDVSDDEGDTVPISPVATCSKPEYKEWDLPSESDDSSQTSDGEESKSHEVCSTLEKEIELIHKALDGKAGSSKEEKDAFLHEFSKLRVTSQEQLNTAQQEKRRLKQELASYKVSSKEKIQKLTELNVSLEKDMERVRIESECRLEEAQEEKDTLRKEIKRLQDQEEAEAAKYLMVNRELQTRLRQYEVAYEQLYYDCLFFQEELKRNSIIIPDVMAKKFTEQLAPLSKVAPQHSPSQRNSLSPEGTTVRVKKERDT